VSQYHLISEAELKRTRRSDTAFIFGSGSSLNTIEPDEWRAIERHDTIGFNWFVHQRFVRCDYQLIREISRTDIDASMWRADLNEYFGLVKSNPLFRSTIFLVQTGFRATSGNRIIGLELVPKDRPVFLWRSILNRHTPTASLQEGLAHGAGTLTECVNFAFLMGWTTIVLVGVDLYDRSCFWLPSGATRFGDETTEVPHNTVFGGIVDMLAAWRERFESTGVRLFVHNPRSLLARVLPVWSARVDT
jgi:hypothetical protein